MDRVIVLAVLLLVGLTWLLYKLTVLLEPRVEKPATNRAEAGAELPAPGQGKRRQKLIHERLRK